MSDELSAEADRRLQDALDESGARDPREFYRERLRELKHADSEAYASAVEYYRATLIPGVASGDRDPIQAWTEYGRRLAEALAPGRTVSIDETGRARGYEAPDRGRLILHLPDDTGAKALLVGLPEVLSDAQRATYDVLVGGRHRSQR